MATDSSVNGRTPPAVAATDALAHALRLGLATHPRFSSAIHQRLILDCLYDIPTQRLDLADLIQGVEARFDGIRLTTGQTRSALGQLEADKVVEVENEDRTGTKRYWLSSSGLRDWELARSAGFALEKRVRDAFFNSINISPDETTRNSTWHALLDALEQLFQREAFHMARAFLDNDNLRESERGAFQRTGAWPDTPTFEMLGDFMRTADGDRLAFLRKLMNGSLALHLFRASPSADAAVREHIRGRTYYLDTTVLYSLVARQGDLSALRNDLVRLTQDLGCRLRITKQTIREFQESVRFYKGLIEQRGISDVSMARALLSPRAIEDLDDFRRGYYQELLRDQTTSIELYALRYETIEEDLSSWGIGAAEAVPTKPIRDQSGKWIELDGIDEYGRSLTEYLKKHPRRGHEENGPDEAAVRHDAIMVAWVQRHRDIRQISVPTRPSQVETWFLTRDRRLTNWDREYVSANGLGTVPRCLTLDDWLEALAVLVPSIRDNDTVNALALRELALTCPPMSRDDELSADDLQQVGKAAEVFELHPFDAARIVADRQFSSEMRNATSAKRRFEAIKAGVIRLKDSEIEALRQVASTQKSFADKATNDAKRQRLELERAEAQRKTLEDARDAMIPDATFGQLQRKRAPVAIVIAVIICAIGAVVIAFNPSFWVTSNLQQRTFGIAAAACVTISLTLAIGGYSRKGWQLFGMIGTTLAFILAVLEALVRLR